MLLAVFAVDRVHAAGHPQAEAVLAVSNHEPEALQQRLGGGAFGGLCGPAVLHEDPAGQRGTSNNAGRHLLVGPSL